MTTLPREPARSEVPPALILVTAMTCGMLAAIGTQVVLARRGIELTDAWHGLSSARPQLRSAAAWWLIAAAAFGVSVAVAATASRLSVPWLRVPMLRWIAGAASVAALAHIGHSAGLKSGGAIGIHVAASLAALCAAMLMALFGAHCAARRQRL